MNEPAHRHEKIRDKAPAAPSSVDPCSGDRPSREEILLQAFFDHFKEKYNATVGTITDEKT